MKLIGFIVLALVFLFPSIAIAQSPSPSASPVATNVPVNSFDLFWPISAGKVAGEPMYFLKSLKENVRGMFIFGDFKKIEYNIILSEKRAVEVEKLFLDKKDYSNGQNTINAMQDKWKLASNWLKSLDDENRDSLKDRFRTSLEKQRALLQYLQTQVPDEQKSVFDGTLQKLNEFLAQV